ncbi:hypothetical protein LEP1GSC068_2308 [Leptospira sp. Fiocruz LV3954]|nr:hypothetical protein LEP1GSC068_2308 [Leptospira sp. Fiocruz LV3954]EMI66596.1 hypothetical protein LEP1GSC076_0312 [Leptospira sp. Fiocruz LV4135]
MSENSCTYSWRSNLVKISSKGRLYKTDFPLYYSRKMAISCRDLILRSLSLNFIEVPKNKKSSSQNSEKL